MQITISQYTVDYKTYKALCNKSNSKTIYINEPPADVICTNYNLYLAIHTSQIDDDKRTYTVLVNTTENIKNIYIELLGDKAKPDKTKTITIPTDKLTQMKDGMPSFGLTFDDNYSMHQFYMPIEQVNFLLTSFPAYWTVDGTFYIGGYNQDEATFIKTVNYIMNQDYYAPIVLYVDADIKVIDYQNIVFTYALLERKQVPVRVVTYKDYKYVEKINADIYKAIQKVPANSHYEKLDAEDITGTFVVEELDKKKILLTYVTNEPLKFTGRSDIVMSDYYMKHQFIPFFVFDESTNDLKIKNAKWINKLKSRPYYLTYKNKYNLNSHSYGRDLLNFLNKQVQFVQIDDDNMKDFHFNQFKEIKNIFTYDSFSKIIISLCYKQDDIDQVYKINLGEQWNHPIFLLEEGEFPTRYFLDKYLASNEEPKLYSNGKFLDAIKSISGDIL